MTRLRWDVRASIALATAGACLSVSNANAQSCDLPAIPDATINTTQDRDQMMCQLGITIPMLPPRLEDQNAPVNAWPRDPNNPEGNWTDPLLAQRLCSSDGR